MPRFTVSAPAAMALLVIAASAVADPHAFPSAPPGFSSVSTAVSSLDEPASTDVRATRSSTSIAVVLPATPASAASASYRVAAYRVNCQAASVKYERVDTVDAGSHRVVSSLSMPKTVWHRPRAGSVEAQALSRTCAR